jgi:protein involved in polysaccharide export with SLBB domain
MRSFSYALGALCAFFAAAVNGQNVIPGNTRPAPAAPAAPLPSSGDMLATGQVVPRDSKLIPGDYVSVKILEDNEDPWRTMITDTGEIELNNLGSVAVNGRTAHDAEIILGAHLRQKYYHRATVEVKILKKAQGFVRPDKVNVAGKVQRAGPQFFNDTNALKLSEAVIIAGTTAFSDLRKVQLTRNGQNTIYDVEAITKKGRTDLDVKLQNGDQIFVRERGIVFGTN